MNVETVSEQLLYEVADPARYYTPDVVADFTTVQLKQAGPDVVAVTRRDGNGVTDTYKVSIAYRDGFMSAGTLVIAGPNAAEKARRSGRDPAGEAAAGRVHVTRRRTSRRSAPATACRAS